MRSILKAEITDDATKNLTFRDKICTIFVKIRYPANSVMTMMVKLSRLFFAPTGKVNDTVVIHNYLQLFHERALDRR